MLGSILFRQWPVVKAWKCVCDAAALGAVVTSLLRLSARENADKEDGQGVGRGAGGGLLSSVPRPHGKFNKTRTDGRRRRWAVPVGSIQLKCTRTLLC